MAVLNAKDVEAALREFHGNMAAVGRKFGVTRAAVWDFVQRRPTLLAATKDCRESMKDHAESSLHRSLMAGEAWAVCFYLKCQAKDRGYVEKSEHDHTHRGDADEPVVLRLVEEIVDADPGKDAEAPPGTG